MAFVKQMQQFFWLKYTVQRSWPQIGPPKVFDYKFPGVLAGQSNRML